MQIDGLVDHFMQFQREQRVLPVVWHQALLCFVQRLDPIKRHAHILAAMHSLSSFPALYWHFANVLYQTLSALSCQITQKVMVGNYLQGIDVPYMVLLPDSSSSMRRYKHEIRKEDKEGLRKLIKVQYHYQVSPEITRELDASR